jgi:hypothetical protein
MWYWYGMVHDLGQEFLVSREVHRLVKSSCKIFFYSKEKTTCMKLHFTKLWNFILIFLKQSVKLAIFIK